MKIRDYIKKFLLEKTASCSARTMSYYQQNLERFLSYLDELHIDYPDDLTRDVYIGYVGYLRSFGIKNTSVRTYSRPVSVFSNWLLDNEYITKSFTYKVKLPKKDDSIVIPLNEKEVKIIDEKIRRFTLYDCRNYLIFHLMLDCGLRRGEVVRLRVQDVNLKDRYIVINNSKGNKSRILPMPDKIYDSAIRYKPLRRCHSFYFSNKDFSPITDNTVKQFFHDLKELSGVLRLHPHLLRHTFATSFILGGGSLEMLRTLLGHSDYTITQNYLHVASQMQILNTDIYKLDKCFFRNYNN